MIVAAHQPLHLPWLGYFDKIARCDVFVLVDDVQYEDQNYQNRNRLKVNNGVVWATVPVMQRSRDELLCEKRIAAQPDGKHHWQRRTWATLEHHYRPSPFYRRYQEELRDIYARPWERLVDLNLHLIQRCMSWLGIERPLLLSSSLGLSGKKTDRILEICRRVGADVYYSGVGGSTDYLDVARMRSHGVEVRWQAFRHPVYPQRYPKLGFVPRLSALDLILNCGAQAAAVLAEGRREPARELLAAAG